jgi:hypothetical protein
MTLFLLNGAIAVTNTAMSLVEKTPATPERSSPMSSRRSSTLAMDSGYTSETDIDQHNGKQVMAFDATSTNDNCTGLLDAQSYKLAASIHSTREEKNDGIIIRHEHLLYAIIAILLLFIIDKGLLAVPIVVGAVAYFAMAVFGGRANVERFLDLSTFHVDWTRKVEIRYVEVEVVVEEKPNDHYYHKIDDTPERTARGAHKEAGTQTGLPATKPTKRIPKDVEDDPPMPEVELAEEELFETERIRNKNRRRGVRPEYDIEKIEGEEEDMERTCAPQTLSQLRSDWIEAPHECPTMQVATTSALRSPMRTSTTASATCPISSCSKAKRWTTPMTGSRPPYPTSLALGRDPATGSYTLRTSSSTCCAGFQRRTSGSVLSTGLVCVLKTTARSRFSMALTLETSAVPKSTVSRMSTSWDRTTSAPSRSAARRTRRTTASCGIFSTPATNKTRSVTISLSRRRCASTPMMTC